MVDGMVAGAFQLTLERAVAAAIPAPAMRKAARIPCGKLAELCWLAAEMDAPVAPPGWLGVQERAHTLLLSLGKVTQGEAAVTGVV
jgi:hypothetical protein